MRIRQCRGDLLLVFPSHQGKGRRLLPSGGVPGGSPAPQELASGEGLPLFSPSWLLMQSLFQLSSYFLPPILPPKVLLWATGVDVRQGLEGEDADEGDEEEMQRAAALTLCELCMCGK